MSVFRVRETNIMDVPRITELSEQLGYRVSQDGIRSRLEYLIQDNYHVIYVAEVDDKVVGWVHASIYKTLLSEVTATILGLVVDHTFHRQGIGRELMRRAEEWARNNGCQGIILKSNVIRQDAHTFYRGIGYENVKSQYVFTKHL
jgi:GNAT superfamily N-acetyltransferase